MLRMAKYNFYYSKIDEKKGDSIGMWKTLKDITNLKNVEDQPNEIVFENGIVETDPIKIANAFNEYFIESIAKIVESISSVKETDVNNTRVRDTINLSRIRRTGQCKMKQFMQMKLQDLDKIMESLNNKGGGTLDGISMRIMKIAYPSIRRKLLYLINVSLETGKFPSKWKETLIIPVPKILRTNSGNEFRPVNMLPVFEKILEICTYGQLESYFDYNKLLTKNQSGFRRNHSCETAVQGLISKWIENNDNGMSTVAIFLDLKRAFETIDRRRLLEKLQYLYGVEGNVLMWIEDYLTGRTQRTKFGNSVSEVLKSDIGVPQGSVLGPFLFLVYINDIEFCVEECSLNLYADDTVIFYSGRDLSEMFNTINREINTITKWLNINMLKLNVNKSKAMFIGSKQLKNVNINDSAYGITVNNIDVEFVSSFKYLGIIIDNKLDFKEHVDYLEKKVRKKIGYLSRISKHLSLYTRLIIYQTIVLPHFTFCTTILYQSYLREINRLQMLQNKGMRCILKCAWYTPIDVMLKILCWLNMTQLINMYAMVFIFKAQNGLLPEMFSNKLVKVKDIHSVGTRSAKLGLLYLRGSKKEILCKSLFYRGVREYNKLPEKVKLSNNVKKFKQLYIENITL